MAQFRVKRRTRTGRSLTAAAQRITEPAKAFKNSAVNKASSDDWQELAWLYADRIGELGYYISWRSAAASRVRLVASDVDPVTGKAVGSTEDATARQILADIGGGVTGQSQMLSRGVALLTVPGEGYFGMLVRDLTREENSDGSKVLPGVNGAPTAPVEEWFTFSRLEIKHKGGSDDLIVTLPDGVKHKFDPEHDMLFRFWNPHPRLASEANSPVRANRDACSEVMTATATIKNAGTSRLIGNGIVFVPQELSLPSQAAPTANPIGEGPFPAAMTGWEQANPQQLQDLLYDVATAAIKDPNSLAALTPIIAAAPGEWIKGIQHLKFGTDIPETAIKTRDKAITRLAMGLDVSPERMLGMADSNHWTGWLVGEDDVRLHIAPPVEVLCEALTKFVYRPALEAAGKDPSKFVIWYDASELTQDPDKSDEAKTAFELGAMTSKALRAHLGFDDEDGYDLATAQGVLEFAYDKCSQDPTLIPMFASVLGPMFADMKAPAVVPAIGAAPAPVEEVPAPKTPPAEPATDPEPDALPASAHSFARLCVGRAMELANKRRRNRSNQAAYEGIPVHLAHTRLAPSADAAKLIDTWDATLTDEDVEAFGFDRDRLSAMVLEAADAALMTAQPWSVSPAAVRAARL